MIRPVSKAAVIKTYAVGGALGADANLVADSAPLFAPEAGRPSEWIVVGVAGDVKITTSKGATDTITLAVGVPVYIEAANLIAVGTTAQKITVGW